MRLILAATLLALTAGCGKADLQPVETASDQPYRLGAGDKVRVTTFNEAALTGEFVIDGAGNIQFPLIGNVPAAGKTREALAADLATRIGTEFLRTPRVTVDVAQFRPVYVFGEVEKPGEYPFTERMTAVALVAKAGGFTFRANRKRIFIRREGEAAEKAFPLAADLVVRPGDQVRVGEALF